MGGLRPSCVVDSLKLVQSEQVPTARRSFSNFKNSEVIEDTDEKPKCTILGFSGKLLIFSYVRMNKTPSQFLKKKLRKSPSKVFPSWKVGLVC